MTDEIVNRYNIAKTLVEGNLAKDLVINDGVFPHWIGNTASFWYQRDTREGKEYRLVDAGAARNSIAFDHAAFARAFSEASGLAVDSRDLPISVIEMTLSPFKIYFEACSKSWIYDAERITCIKAKKNSEAEDGLRSPDGKKMVFVRDFNIWLLDLTTGQERALTQGGSRDLPYATAPCVYGQPNLQPQVIWSPDSKRLLTHQLDLRGVATRRQLLLTQSDDGLQQKLTEHIAAYPGDETVETYRFVSIQIGTDEKQVANYQDISLCRFGLGYFSDEKLGWWGSDSCTAYFVDIERGAKSARVIEFDTNSGSTRSVINETSGTFIRLSHAITERPLFKVLPNTDELIWFSERDGWGHLYLYDLKTGELKRRITEGKWLVRSVLYVDTVRRELLVQTSGRDPSINPYYQDVCRVLIDSSEVIPLACGPYEHVIFGPDSLQTKVRTSFNLDVPGVNGIAPSGDYVVITRSRVDTLPISLLLDRDGTEILKLETTEITGLPKDWCWPEPIAVKSADGEIDLYGVLFRPPGFSEGKTYPVLDFCQAFPYYSSIPQGSFINDPFCGDSYLVGAAYAALGFIVVAVNLPGMPYRDKVFQDASYGYIPSVNAFEDRISSFKQLAQIYPSMDLDRVGIVGCDYLTGAVYGLLEHPEFYKVGVNVAFDDARYGIASMVEMYEGVKVPQRPYTDELVKSLQGNLLLIHGLCDLDASPLATLQLADALQKANKNFDMILEPEGIHIVSSYALRRTWDYLTRHLLGLEPPKSFKVTTAYDRVFGKTDSNGDQLAEDDSVQESEERSAC